MIAQTMPRLKACRLVPRYRQISAARSSWPRMQSEPSAISLGCYRDKYSSRLLAGQDLAEQVVIRGAFLLSDSANRLTVRTGRVWRVRKSGGRLVFVDVWQAGIILQCVLNAETIPDVDFQAYVKTLKRGDVISMFLLLLSNVSIAGESTSLPFSRISWILFDAGLRFSGP